LAVLAVVAAALLAVFGLPYGASNPEAFAHLYTHPASNVQTHLHIDANITNGNRPCDPLDATATVAVGTVHKVGVCLETYDPNSVNNFQLTVFYNGDPSDNVPPVLNLASEKSTAAPALDDSPDANDGDSPAGLKLGGGWDCTGLGLAFPVGDDPATPTVADAFIVCNASLATPDQDLAVSPGLLATIEFTAQAAGLDTLSFGPADATNTTNVQNPVPGGNAARCGNAVPADQIGCFGATITKVADLSIVKTVLTSPVVAGSNVTFNLAASTNAAPGPAMVFDDLANDLVYDDVATDLANGANLCSLATLPTGVGDGINVVACGDVLNMFGTGGTAMVIVPANIKIVAKVPLAAAGKSRVNIGVVAPTDPNPANNASVIMVNVAAANVAINKTADKATYSEGESIIWSIAANSNGVSPASAVVITDTVDANQAVVSAALTGASAVAYDCAESGSDNFVAGVCTLDDGSGPANTAVVGTVTAQVVADVVGSVGNVCSNEITAGFADPTVTVTCLPPTVRMEKDIDQDATSIDNDANLCLIKNPQGGLQCLTIYELVSNPGNDPDGVGAFEFELKYDHNVFQQPIIAPTVWLTNGGTRTIDCSMTIINESSIWFGCVSTGPVPGQTSAGTAATITLCPQPDLVNRLTPGQDNGVATPILDENCQMADVLGDPLALVAGAVAPLAPGILPGGQVAICSDMEITVRILEGDLNLDGVVNVLDEGLIAYRYGATFGSLLYSPWYDLQPNLKDYDIDIKDLQKVWGRQGSVCGINGEGTIPPQPPEPLPDP